MFAQIAAALPAKRIGKPEDIGEFTTGATIPADGGHLLQ
jgi:hypothetical protein